jgi:hypothetical protein
LDREIERLRKEGANLTKGIRIGGKMAALVKDLKATAKSIKQAEEKKATILKSFDEECTMTREELAEQWPQHFCRFAKESRTFAQLLRKLLPKFIIQPVQDLDCLLVRPRAYLTLSTAAWCEDGEVPLEISTTIDLFEPPVHIKYMAASVALRKEHPRWGLRRIATQRGTSYMTVKRSLRYAKIMESLGMTDPYRELHEAPAAASRWKVRTKEQKRSSERSRKAS